MNSEPITIALVSDAVYPFNRGGKETRIFELASRLVARGHRVTIYTMNWWNGAPQQVADGLTFRAICPYVPLYSEGRRSFREAIVFALSCWRLLFFGYDILDADSMPYLPLFMLKLVSVIKRKPLVVHWHEVWSRSYWQYYVGWRGFPAFYLEKAAAYLPDRLIAVSPLTKEAIGTVYGRTGRVALIPNGIDMAAIDAVPPAKVRRDVLYAGRLLSHKHVDILVSAIARIRRKRQPLPVKLTIIGDGPERLKLTALVSQLGLASVVTFRDFLPSKPELFAILKSAGLFVLPSTREGFGLSVLEANACGLPVITVDHPQNAARLLILPGQNGFLVPLSAADLADTILSVLTSGKQSVYRKESRAVAATYDWNRSVRDLERIYKQVRNS